MNTDITLDVYDCLGLYVAKRALQIDPTLTPLFKNAEHVGNGDGQTESENCLQALEEYLDLEEAARQ